MLELISIHIPKTAGRSLLSVLNTVYGEQHVIVVNRKLFKEDYHKGIEDLRKRITSSTKVIHGHIHYSEIKELLNAYPKAKLITFLRDPVERVVSHYYYEKKILEERGHLSGFKEVPVDSLLSYAAHPESQNLMYRFLKGANETNLFFTGNFTSFDNDVKRLGGVLGWPDVVIPKENYSSLGKTEIENISSGDKETIRKFNLSDIELFNKLILNKKSNGHAIQCWIASFPRSGNTFFRNILYYVYGIESGTWHKETAFPVDDDYDQFTFVKTHLLPEELVPADPDIPAIYLVRDGRDAIVSIAHHRSELVSPGTDFLDNIREAIVAAEGSFFGGWSKNVTAWVQRAQLIIRYEDLVSDPVAVFKRVEQLIPLPPANWKNLPSFEEMKSGKPKYGGTTKLTDPKFDPEIFASRFFRKGKAGSWKEEMPSELQDLFRNYHGNTMERLGYSFSSHSSIQNPLLDYRVMKLMGIEIPEKGNKKIHILIEASKLTQPGNDGIKRYLINLLKGCEEVTLYGDPRFTFELLIGRRFLPLESYRQMLRLNSDELHDYEKVLMGFKKIIQNILPGSIYKTGSSIYKKTNARKFLKTLQQKKSISKELEFYEELESKKNHVDLLHIPLPQNSEHLKSLSHRFVVTVHDITHILFPEFHESENITLTESGMEFIAGKKCDVIAVSENTIHDLKKYYSLPGEKIHLVYESPDKDLFKWNTNIDLAVKVRSKYKIGSNPYFLCLSTIEPRKNLPNTIRAFNLFVKEFPQSNANLVIAGSHGWKTEHLSKELHANNERIIFTGYVDDIDLSVIYSESIALCYVSFYEGFGLPPIEAMSCRTPVIYGNNSSMKEVIKEAGLAADANDINSIKDQMHIMFFDKTLREELAQKSHHRAFEFSWRKSICDALKVYERIIYESTNTD